MSRGFCIVGIAMALPLLLVAGESDAPFKLAVIGEEKSALSGLLAVRLSQSPGMVLVERAELSRLVDEERLAGLVAEKKFAALGTLLSADGLVILEKIRLPGGTEETTARLVSVRNGACLLFLPVPPGALPEEWAEGFARQVVRTAPMAQVGLESALPISVLNLRASVFSSDAALREVAVVRLLEARLAASPGVVLLERRRLRDAVFERSLDAADLPSLWESAILVDGSIEAALPDGTVGVRLRLRGKDGKVIGETLEIAPTGTPSEMADCLAKAVLEKLQRPDSAPRGTFEPDTFFDEAVWACRSGLFERAEESLAAARALGEKSPDSVALETWLLLQRLDPKGRFFDGNYLKSPLPSLTEQSALQRRALECFLDYRQTGKLERISGSFASKLEVGSLKHELIQRGSEFLFRNDRAEAPGEVTEFRTRMRELAGMDPSGAAMPYSLAMSSRYAREWAANGHDLIAYYEKLLRADHKWLSSLLKYFPSDAQTALGPRFQDDDNVVSAWKGMWKRLLADPHTRLRALLVLSRRAETPEQDALYREYLTEVGKQGRALFESNQLKTFLEPDSAGNVFHQRFSQERTETLLALCRTLPGYESTIYSMVAELRIPTPLVPAVAKEFAAYRERCLATAADENRRATLERDFIRLGSLLQMHNPAFSSDRVNPESSLHVRRFWHPFDLPGRQMKPFGIHKIVSDGEGSVWMTGADIGKDVLMQVEIPSLKAQVHQIKGAGRASSLTVTPETIWLAYDKEPGEDHPAEMTLVRQDRKSGVMKEISLPRPGKVQIVGDRIFLSFGNIHEGNVGGLIEIDSETGAAHVLVSARRDPPQSPFDNSSGWSAEGVIRGPGNALFMLLHQPSGLYELGGKWGKLADILWASVLQYGGQSLLVGARGEAIRVDPTLPTPVWWLADKSNAATVDARWTGPAAGMDLRGEAAAFREDELFVVKRDGAGRHALLWWFRDGPRGGISVPLHFDFPKDQATRLEPLRPQIGGRVVRFEGLLDPNRVMLAINILATREGLILHHRDNGFWFIPNADLDEWRQNHFPTQKTP